MRKIVTLQVEVELEDDKYARFSNSELVDIYNDSGLTLFDYYTDRMATVISVNDTVESEKADADSTGETNGPTGLYEVPC